MVVNFFDVSRMCLGMLDHIIGFDRTRVHGSADSELEGEVVRRGLASGIGLTFIFEGRSSDMSIGSSATSTSEMTDGATLVASG